MPEAKKYYWLKLKRDFFKRHDIRIIEDMENGKDYILFYLKLLVESIDHGGELRFSDTIPYNEKMLSTITNTNIDVVRAATQLFTELAMMQKLDDGTLFFAQVEEMTGSEGWSTSRVRRFREKQKQLQIEEAFHETKSNVTETKSKSKSKSKIKKEKYMDCVYLSETENKKLMDKFGEKQVQQLIAKLNFYKMEKGKTYKSDYGAINSWVISACDVKPIRAVQRCPKCNTPRAGSSGLCVKCKEDVF